jgi:hypothetical protein
MFHFPVNSPPRLSNIIREYIQDTLLPTPGFYEVRPENWSIAMICEDIYNL